MGLASRLFKGDRVIWGVFMFLCLVSIVEVFSASSTLAYKSDNYWDPISTHATYLLMGFIFILLLHNVPYKMFVAAGILGLPVSFVLLLLTPFIGIEINGEPRWMSFFGVFNFQPSEIAKLCAVCYMALILSWREMLTEKQMFWSILIGVGIVFLLIFSFNGSTALLLFGVMVMMMFIGQIAFNGLPACWGFASVRSPSCSVCFIFSTNGGRASARTLRYVEEPHRTLREQERPPRRVGWQDAQARRRALSGRPRPDCHRAGRCIWQTPTLR